MSLIHNERTKLSANALNTAATSCFTVGVLAPLAAAFYNVGLAVITLRPVAIGAAFWLGIALLLHYQARLMLGSLKP